MNDVIVCGAGPAGATAARVCAGRGLSVLLLEARDLPRDKACAGGLTAAAYRELPGELPDELAEYKCATFRPTWAGDTMTVIRASPFATTVDRGAFDHWLARQAVAAGARLITGERVIRIERHHDRMAVITASGVFRAQVVLGCDGVTGPAARFVRGPICTGASALTASAEIPADDETVARLTGGSMQIEYGPGAVGYSWLFPKRGRVAIGLGGQGTNGASLTQALGELAARHGLPAPTSPRVHLVPLGHVRQPVIADRMLLAGDAAALADPFSGEGIRYAMASGRLAASVVADVLRRGIAPERSALAAYDTLCESMRADFRAAHRLIRLVSLAPGLSRRVIFDTPRIVNRILDVMDGQCTYRDVLREIAVRAPLLLASTAIGGLTARRRRPAET